MAIERFITGEQFSEEEKRVENTLRPATIDEYVGQKNIVEKLSISLEAARRRKEPLEHTLLHGPPGLGKTTLAHIISHEMGSKIVVTSGPALERPGDLIGILTNLEESDVLFIDEIHRLPKVVEEFLYPAMEDFKIDFIVDKGAFAKTIAIPLKRFTLIGATTRAGLLTSPLRERFGLFYHLDLYPVDELDTIVKRSAGILSVPIIKDASEQIARRSRGTPRIANRLLKRVRDYAQVRGDGSVTLDIVDKALTMEGIDELGLDELDHKLLRTIIKVYKGGPVGVEALAATLNMERDTIEDMVEPYLLHIGFVTRTRSGRVATEPAFAHIKASSSGLSRQEELF